MIVRASHLRPTVQAEGLPYHQIPTWSHAHPFMSPQTTGFTAWLWNGDGVMPVPVAAWTRQAATFQTFGASTDIGHGAGFEPVLIMDVWPKPPLVVVTPPGYGTTDEQVSYFAQKVADWWFMDEAGAA